MHPRATALRVMALVMVSFPLRAQDSIPAHVIKTLKRGSYVVVIRSDTLIAITQQAAQQALTLQAELEGARAEVRVKDSVLATYQRAINWSDTTVVRQKVLIAELDSLYRGYRDVAAGYKRLSGEPWLTFEGGLGATGADHRPAILAGVGIRNVRVWGFLQERNSGGFVGVSLRLF